MKYPVSRNSRWQLPFPKAHCFKVITQNPSHAHWEREKNPTESNRTIYFISTLNRWVFVAISLCDDFWDGLSIPHETKWWKICCCFCPDIPRFSGLKNQGKFQFRNPKGSVVNGGGTFCFSKSHGNSLSWIQKNSSCYQLQHMKTFQWYVGMKKCIVVNVVANLLN